MSATGSVEAGLLFTWDAPRRRMLAITGFLGASVVLHAFCFYLFQIVYAPAVVLLPPPARVNLITPSSEEGRSLLRWVDAEDPALAAATQRPPETRQRQLPKVQHVPSYLLEEPKLKSIPPLVISTRAPSSQLPGPVEISKRQPTPDLGSVATRAVFSDEFKSLGPVSLPPSHFTASNHEAPEALRFRIAVSPRGEVRYGFLLNSSGDPTLDEQGWQYLVRARFPQAQPAEASDSDGALIWGIAIVEWGNDVAAPPASTETAP